MMSAHVLRCANCHRPLDATDKFCRDCGLPTLHRAEAHAQMPIASPDTGEMQRALDAAPDPRPFLREEPADVLSDSAPSEPLTTGAVMRGTNPTFAAQLASSTALMVGAIVVLVVAGLLMLFFAFRP